MRLSNPLRPRAFGGKGAEGMKKEIPSNNAPTPMVRLNIKRMAPTGLTGSHQAAPTLVRTNNPSSSGFRE